jgi:hypothetical protein
VAAGSKVDHGFWKPAGFWLQVKRVWVTVSTFGHHHHTVTRTHGMVGVMGSLHNHHHILTQDEQAHGNQMTTKEKAGKPLRGSDPTFQPTGKSLFIIK